MAATTTIRVSTDTRDLLKGLSARRKRPAGEIVAELVHRADDDLLLADAEAGFAQMARDPGMLASYRTQTHEVGVGFDAAIPEW